jgi:hypothetical protein
MTTDNINYAYITGSYEGMLSSLAYSLASKGIVSNDTDTYVKLKEYFSSEVDRIRQAERDFTNPQRVISAQLD